MTEYNINNLPNGKVTIDININNRTKRDERYLLRHENGLMCTECFYTTKMPNISIDASVNIEGDLEILKNFVYKNDDFIHYDESMSIRARVLNHISCPKCSFNGVDSEMVCIDSELAETLVNLNSHKYKTEYHCIGSIDGDDTDKLNYTSPYISFVDKRAFIVLMRALKFYKLIEDENLICEPNINLYLNDDESIEYHTERYRFCMAETEKFPMLNVLEFSKSPLRNNFTIYLLSRDYDVLINDDAHKNIKVKDIFLDISNILIAYETALNIRENPNYNKVLHADKLSVYEKIKELISQMGNFPSEYNPEDTCTDDEFNALRDKLSCKIFN